MIPSILFSFIGALLVIIIVPLILKLDQSLSAVANRALFSSPTGGFVRYDGYAGTGLKQGLVIKMNSVTRVMDLAQNNADPNSADQPFGVVDEQMDVDIDTALTAADALRAIGLKSGAIVWLLFSGGEATSTNGVTRGQEVELSVNDAGMVRVTPDQASLIENTPTTGGLADEVQVMKGSSKCRIGTAMETNALHASEDRWAPVRLD